MIDNTEVFKKMCEKADLEWNPKFGDNVYYKITNEIGIVRSVYKEWVCFSIESENEGVFEFTVPKDYFIPLWRQDQLQDKVRSKLTYTDAIGGVWKLYNAVGVNRSSPYARLNSLEKIWLAFVMEEKFGKVWDGKDWVEEAKVPRKGGMIDRYGDIK